MQHSCSTFLLSYLAPVTTNAFCKFSTSFPLFVSSKFLKKKCPHNDNKHNANHHNSTKQIHFSIRACALLIALLFYKNIKRVIRGM